jgi:hypothetical protein
MAISDRSLSLVFIKIETYSDGEERGKQILSSYELQFLSYLHLGKISNEQKIYIGFVSSQLAQN